MGPLCARRSRIGPLEPPPSPRVASSSSISSSGGGSSSSASSSRSSASTWPAGTTAADLGQRQAQRGAS
eukprot:11065619-Alexandrium_andersonii.AAC.1